MTQITSCVDDWRPFEATPLYCPSEQKFQLHVPHADKVRYHPLRHISEPSQTPGNTKHPSPQHECYTGGDSDHWLRGADRIVVNLRRYITIAIAMATTTQPPTQSLRLNSLCRPKDCANEVYNIRWHLRNTTNNITDLQLANCRFGTSASVHIRGCIEDS